MHEQRRKKDSTIYDIAKQMGVSPSTVSRTLNGIGNTTEDTRMRILATAKQLNYVPNPAARYLKTKKTNQIMLSMPDLNNPFYFDMISAIQVVAKDNGYLLVLNYSEASEQEELQMLDSIQRNFVDGLIMVSINISDRHMKKLEVLNCPVVISSICADFNTGFKPLFDYVGVDTKKGLYLAAKHLINQGHTSLGYVGLALETLPGKERYEGFCKALNESGLAIDRDLVWLRGYTESTGYEAGIHFAESGHLPTAVCTANDQIALGLYRAFEQKGLRIPQDISIVGMDNTNIAAIIKPKMSTIAIAQAEIGRTAAELIFKRLNGYKEPFQNIIYQPRLVVRESSVNRLVTGR
jgi:LacI family transcriptional regulator